MSRIGKKTIKVPSEVQIRVDGVHVFVKGPKGQLEKKFPGTVAFEIKGDQAMVTLAEDSDDSVSWGLSRALLANMIKGVSVGFEKELEFSGVGFKAQAKDENLELNLGFSHPILVKIPKGITFQTDKTSIRISGINKEEVGQLAATIRSYRLPEPFKGSGIKYKDEIIKRKAGKKAATVGT